MRGLKSIWLVVTVFMYLFSNTQRVLGSEENRKSRTLVQGCRVGKDAFLVTHFPRGFLWP